MTNDFQHFMNEATRLTRSGDLQAATAAIQSALRGGAPDIAATTVGAAVAVDAIDVESRELPSRDGSQFIAGNFATASGRRDYKLFLPSGAGGKPMPLVVMLHGCTQDPDDFAAGTDRKSVV